MGQEKTKTIFRRFISVYFEYFFRTYADFPVLLKRKAKAVLLIYPIFFIMGLIYIFLSLMIIGYSSDIPIVSASLLLLAVIMLFLKKGYYNASISIFLFAFLIVLSITVFVSKIHEPTKIYNLAVICIISLLIAGLAGENVLYSIVVGAISLLLLSLYTYYFVIPDGLKPINIILDSYLSSLIFVGIGSFVSTALNYQINRLIQDISQANEKLDAQVEEKTKQLNRSQKRLVESEKLSALGGLVGGVGHEINTPIGVSITASSHLMMTINEYRQKMQYGPLSDLDLVDFFDTGEKINSILETNLNRVKSFVENFKMVSSDFLIQESVSVDVGDEIEKIIGSYNQDLIENGIKYKIEGSSHLFFTVYPNLFMQILSNLIENAIIHAFSESSGNIVIRYKMDGSNLILEYKDDGAGMEKDVIKHLFEPFYTTRRGEGRTGLGMLIIYNIIQKSGGEIDVKSTPGVGTSYVIRLPEMRLNHEN